MPCGPPLQEVNEILYNISHYLPAQAPVSFICYFAMPPSRGKPCDLCVTPPSLRISLLLIIPQLSPKKSEMRPIRSMQEVRSIAAPMIVFRRKGDLRRKTRYGFYLVLNLELLSFSTYRPQLQGPSCYRSTKTTLIRSYHAKTTQA